MWAVPRSPEPVVQEREGVAGHPWRLLVVCMLCNRSRGEAAWPVALDLFARWPEATDLADACPQEVAEIILPLGLQNRRARRLIDLSAAYSRTAWRDVRDLPGVGRYARDAWAIFVEGRTDVMPDDHYLNRYVEWRIAVGSW